VLSDTAQVRSTRETAPSYADAMRNPTILLPLLFILADGVACKDDEPTGAEFGEPCGGTRRWIKPCADGLECFIGYCEETMRRRSVIANLSKATHECVAGVCHIYCDEAAKSARRLSSTPLECVHDVV
jgi:hypothetical protein